MNDDKGTVSGAPLTVDEILSGSTQGGITPPASFRPHEDDGTVDSRVPPELRAQLAALDHKATGNAAPDGGEQRAAPTPSGFFSAADLAEPRSAAGLLSPEEALRQARIERDEAYEALKAANERYDRADRAVADAKRLVDAGLGNRS